MEKERRPETKDKTESIEEHYAKIYSDLPEEVVKMLISTHPLYGENKGETKRKELTEDELSSIKKPMDEIEQAEEELEEEDETEEIEDEEDETEGEDEEEKEFLSSLFSNPDKMQGKAIWKKFVLAVLVVGVFFTFGITVYTNIKNKQRIADLQSDKFLLEEKLDTFKIERQQLLEKNSNLISELESLKQNSGAMPEQTAIKNNSVAETTVQQTAKVSATTPSKKTYTVVTGDSFWKISQKTYGSGKYYLDIMKANNIKKEGDIVVGMTLDLPDIKGGKQ